MSPRAQLGTLLAVCLGLCLLAPSVLVSSASAQSIDEPADAYMMAVVYRGGKELERWNGPIDWGRATPTQITVERKRDKWIWSRQDARSLAVQSPDREKGGVRLAQWARKLNGDRVLVIIVPDPGEPLPDAGTEGLDVQGQGQGRGQSHAQTARRADARGPDTEGQDEFDRGQGEPGQGQGERGDGRGYGQGEGDGRGTHESGSRDGSKQGSEDPSWFVNATSDIAKNGGRTPADHGKVNGSAAGEAGAKGHLQGAGWLNWIDVPVQLSGAASIIAIAMSADVSGLAKKLFQKVVRSMARAQLKRHIAREIRAQARRHVTEARAALKANADRLGADELAHAQGHAAEHVEIALYARLQAHSRKQAARYQAILDEGLKGTDEVSERGRRLVTENLDAWKKIEDVAGAEGRALKAKLARPPDSVARQPYDPHRQRAALESSHPGKVDSTTVPKRNHPNVKHRGKHAPGSDIPIDVRGFPIFNQVAMYDVRLPRKYWKGRSRRSPQRAATRDLRSAIKDGRVSSKKFTREQLEAIRRGRETIPGYIWHHHQDVGRMQLVPQKYHEASQHVGGYAMWQRSR